MASVTQQVLELEERNLLREQMLEPEELYLIQYLKSYDRKASQELQSVYGYDINSEL